MGKSKGCILVPAPVKAKAGLVEFVRFMGREVFLTSEHFRELMAMFERLAVFFYLTGYKPECLLSHVLGWVKEVRGLVDQLRVQMNMNPEGANFPPESDLAVLVRVRDHLMKNESGERIKDLERAVEELRKRASTLRMEQELRSKEIKRFDEMKAKICEYVGTSALDRSFPPDTLRLVQAVADQKKALEVKVQRLDEQLKAEQVENTALQAEKTRLSERVEQLAKSNRALETALQKSKEPDDEFEVDGYRRQIERLKKHVRALVDIASAAWDEVDDQDMDD
jgi:hypothetical protein